MNRPRNVVPLITLIVLLGTAGTAHAAFPGKNGSIAFARYNYGTSTNPWDTGEVLSIDDASGITKLTDRRLSSGNPSWSADGSLIAFARDFRERIGNRKRIQSDVMVMDPVGENVSRLTHTKRKSEFHPTWSPDGSMIAYYRGGGIWVMDSDGSDPVRITDPPEGFIDGNPNWSPDGSAIAFWRQGGSGYSEIYTVAPDGSAITRLTDNTLNDFDPNWSPDGTRIAFSGDTPDSGYQIFTMDADGGNLVQVTSGNRNAFTPAFSPDGTMIAYARSRGPISADLWTIGVDGTGKIRLTAFSNGRIVLDPDWQPLEP